MLLGADQGDRSRNRGTPSLQAFTEALRAIIEYIHAYPVRRGMVARAEDWEWSSTRWYAVLRPVSWKWARGGYSPGDFSRLEAFMFKPVME
jgi:hypothetical protein